MPLFSDKVVAITGAGSGIGRALALAFSRHQAKLLLSDINPTTLAETQQLCYQAGTTQVHCYPLDVANRTAVEHWATLAQQHYGQVDILINNAGVALVACVEQMQYEDFEWLMGINFWGVVHGCKSFLPLLKQSSAGHIVNISSLFGLISIPNQSAYNAAKFAVRGFSESLSEEMQMAGKSVSVTCVHPGGIKTNIINNSRMGTSLGLGQGGQPLKQRLNHYLTTSADQAAKQILTAIAKKRRRLVIGYDAKALDMLQRCLPSRYQQLVSQTFKLF